MRLNERLPDALVLTPRGEIETAIELELTAKSDKRYREIILQYRLSTTYKSVLYVTATKSIADKIKVQIFGRPVPGLSTPQSTGKFSFVLLNEIRSAMTRPSIYRSGPARVPTAPSTLTEKGFTHES